MNEIILQTPNPAVLMEEIIEAISVNKFKSWEVKKERDQISIQHNSDWGRKGLILIETDTFQPKGLSVRVEKLPKVKKDLTQLSAIYLSRFCEVLFSSFQEEIIALIPVKQ